jgi:ABC-type multidrug transport system fused ATPase/permease subunit
MEPGFPRAENDIPTFNPFRFSNLLFTWYEQKITLGAKRPLTKNDMMSLPLFMTSVEVFSTFKQCWALEAMRVATARAGYALTSPSPESPELKPRLWRVLHTLIFTEFWICGVCRLLNDGLLVLGTVWIKYIVRAAENQDVRSSFFYAGMITLSSLAQAFMLQQFIHGSFMSGSRVVCAATSAVSHATLGLRIHKMNPHKSLGEIGNVLSKDTSNLRDAVVFFHNLWACPLQIVVCVGLLFYMLGSAGIVSCILLAALIPVEKAVGKRAREARKKVSVHSDKRLALVNELIDGIWTVKLTNLAPFVHEKITALREAELYAAWQGMLISTLNAVVTRSATILITLLTFLFFSLAGNDPLTSDRAFASLAIINILGRPMQVIPTSVSLVVEALVSLERIESVILEAMKYEPLLYDPKQKTADAKQSPFKGGESIEAAVRVSVMNVTASRGAPDSVTVLKNISFDLAQPGLVIISGGNASGKSSLLLAILNELTFKEGTASITPRASTVAYSGHEPWIVNATAKENILLACRHLPESAREERYAHSLQACALVADFNEWVDGDGTLIGEKGINISGGQRQRLSLARVLCSDAQVYLLDAPMSGLDVVVQSQVFTKAILAAAKTKLVIMTDCQFKSSILSHSQRFIFCNNGQIVFDGTFAEASKAGVLASVSSYVVEETSSALPLTSDRSPPLKSVSLDPRAKHTRNEKHDDVNVSTRTADTYIAYFRSCGLRNVLAALLLSLTAYGMSAFADYQVAYWTDGEYSNDEFLRIYAVLSVLVVCANFGRYLMINRSGLAASKAMHSALLNSILGAKFSFFDSTPSGRITSRFSVDFDMIDFSIPSGIGTFQDAVLGIFTGVGVVVVSSPVYLLLIAPLVWKYLEIQQQYRNVSTVLKKIDSGAKSPLLSHLKETLTGLETIRAFGIEEQLSREFHALLDFSICSRLNWDFANRWMGIRLDIIGSIIVGFSAFLVAVSTLFSSTSGGHAGLMISYALKATQSMTIAIRSSAALENSFTSPERVQEYIALEQEVGGEDGVVNAEKSKETKEEKGVYGAVDTAASLQPKTALFAENIIVRYRPDLPPALIDLSFELGAGKLVGVCGRTGCGKSTTSLLIARAVDFQGHLQIAGKPHKEVSLLEYRRTVQVFPQNSFIFSGKLRHYLDPRAVHDDATLNRVLGDLAQAIEFASEGATTSSASAQAIHLSFLISPGGANLSAGQKQVVALARAALCGAEVVVLDEIISNMDADSAQRAIGIMKRELVTRGAAVLLIAHSVSEIAMCDEVWVMSGGRIVECGSPDELLRNDASFFAQMSSVSVGGKQQK